MKTKIQTKQAFEEGWNYAKLKMVLLRDTKNVRKNSDTVNNNNTQQQ